MAIATNSEAVRLADKIWSISQRSETSKRILVGIAGIPGAGKSTLALGVANALRAVRLRETGVGSDGFVADLPMDGYHLTRAQLAAMPDPATAIHRRGAAFTFDGEGFLTLVKQLHEPIGPETPTIYAPSFDHAVKDPVENSIHISPSTRIVIIEGNYLCLNREPWASAALLMDELWFVDVDREVARERLVKRHVASGIVPDEEAARHRIRTTDFLNADDIMENLLPMHERVNCS